MKQHSTSKTCIVALVIGFMFLEGALVSQAATPLLRIDFESGTLEQGGWIANPVTNFNPAFVTISTLPISPAPNFPAGQRALQFVTDPGEGSLLFGPGVIVGNQPAILRMQILASGGGGQIAIGALNFPSTGSLGNTNGSVGYALETDSMRYAGSYQQVTVLFRPQGQALAPVIQLVVPQRAGQAPVTLIVDNLEVYSLDTATVTDPALRDLLGVTGNTTLPTPTPTLPPNQPTPTVTPLPGNGTDILMDDIYTISPVNDAKAGNSPEVAFDQNNFYSLVAQEETGTDAEKFKDILLENVDIALNTVSEPVTVNSGFQDTIAQQPDLDIDFAGTRHVVWSDNRATVKLYSIYLAQVDSFGAKLNDTDMELNRLFNDTDAYNPSIALQDNGNAAVVWYDNRNFLNDIFVSRVSWDSASKKATPFDNPKDFAVNVPFENTNAVDPDVAMDTNGNVVAVWSDDRVNLGGQKRKDVYARVFTMQTQLTTEGKLPTSAQEISLTEFNSTVLDHAIHPKVAHSAGFYLTVWENSASTGRAQEIRGAVISAQGAVLMPEFVISYSDTNRLPELPSVSTYGEGLFIVTWHDSTTNQIFGRVFDAKTNRFLTESLSLLDAVTGTGQTAVAMGDNSRFLLGWDGKVNNILDIYAASGAIDFSGSGVSAALPLKEQALEGGLSPRSVKIMQENVREGAGVKKERESGETSAKR